MLAEVAFKIPGVVLVSVAAVVLVTLVSVNSDLTGAFGAIAGVWFAIHQVPLSIAGTSLGVLPLLPTLVLVAVSVRMIAKVVSDRTTSRELIWIAAAAVGGPVLITAVALAVAKDASTVIGLSSPAALLAFAWVAALHLIAVGLGMAVARWNTTALRREIPDWLRDVVAPAIRATMIFVAGGAFVLLLTMLASWSTVEALLETGGDFVGMLGLTIVSILYLPNVLMGTLAVVTGSSSSFGSASASLFATTGGPLPPLPILAVFPEGPADKVWVAMVVVPIIAGIVLGRDCAKRSADLHIALSSVWTAAAGVGVVAGAVGFCAGGNLGTFGTVEITIWSFALLTFAWLAVVGSLSAALTVWRRPAEVLPEANAEDSRPARPSEPVAHPELALDAEVVEDDQALQQAPDGEVIEAEVVDAAPEAQVQPNSGASGPAAAESTRTLDPEPTGLPDADESAEPLEAEIVEPIESGELSGEDLPDGHAHRGD